MSRTGAYSYGQTGQRYGSSISGQPTSRYSRYSTTLPSANATTTRSASSVRDVFRSTAACTRLPSSTSRAPYSSLPSGTSRTSYTSLPATTSRSAYSTIRTPTTAAAATHPNGTCDKCDGPHQTDKCTVFTKGRENHVDATRRRPPKVMLRSVAAVTGCVAGYWGGRGVRSRCVPFISASGIAAW